MPIQHSLWRVGSAPQLLREAVLPSEALLEKMIVVEPSILSREWMIIGRQEDTGFGGRIDLLALAPDGALILVELKRSKTPREVVAQAIDYASWAERLEAQDIIRIYSNFSKGRSLDDDFIDRFGQALDPETLNQSHQIVIVASELDAASERIVEYLNRRDIPIKCFASKCSSWMAINCSAALGFWIPSKPRSLPRLVALRQSRSLGMASIMPRLVTTGIAIGKRRVVMASFARVAVLGTAERSGSCRRATLFGSKCRGMAS